MFSFLGHRRLEWQSTGPNTWYYTLSVGDATSNAILSTGYQNWSQIVFAQAGTLTTLRAYFYNNASGSAAFKMALYSSDGGTLIANGGAASVPIISSTVTAVDLTGLSVSVAAATYQLSITTSVANVSIALKTSETNGARYWAQSYAGFPASSLPTGTAYNSRLLMAAFVQ